MVLKYKFILLFSLFELLSVSADTYSVNIGTEHFVNVVDKNFLSFTIDPKYLFSSSEKYKSKECICMASSLTPAYLRIAGPSTSNTSFHNTTISITDLDVTDIDKPKKIQLDELLPQNKFKRSDRTKKVEDIFSESQGQLEVSHRQWRRFVEWAKSAGFDLVFALNNEERTASGMWDPNVALNILTVAEKASVGDIFWQLGYECTNQSIEEYLNDLETLRVILETFPPGREGAWRVVGGDITPCLHEHSKSDFKDYVTLSTDMMDAVLLNGNSSSQELQRMSNSDRVKLLQLLGRSTTPLWLTETPHAGYNELERAADWLSSLGYSARNGFAVHFRELLEEEMYDPTLSFYMALLFKNLVGERVLDVEMEPEQAILFAHCTSLRHEAVPGAVTLYGANMDDEPARLSLKLSKREEGGDIMQFILGQDHSGNIVVNSRAMYHEGDIRPVVKRVRPYKTLLINLPPKSFGFWVLANTNVDACHDDDDKDNDEKLVETETVHIDEEEEGTKEKRSIIDDDFDDYSNIDDTVDFSDHDSIELSGVLKHRVNNLNNDLNIIHKLFRPKSVKKGIDLNKLRLKRHAEEDKLNEQGLGMLKRLGLRKKGDKIKSDADESKLKGLLRNLFPLGRRNITRHLINNRLRNLTRFGKNKVSKRNPKKLKVRPRKQKDDSDAEKSVFRIRRCVKDEESSTDEDWKENEIETEGKDSKLWKIVRRINKQLQHLTLEEDGNSNDKDNNREIAEMTEKYIEEAKHEEDDITSVKFNEDEDYSLISSTVENLTTVLVELNNNLNRFWNALTL